MLICKQMILCPFPVPELGFLPCAFLSLMRLLIESSLKYSKVHSAAQVGLMAFQHASPSLDPGTEYSVTGEVTFVSPPCQQSLSQK